MSSDDKELLNACLDLARTTKWVRKPIDVSDLMGFAGKLEAISKCFVSSELDIDEPLIARAIRYLAHVHALPVMEEDTDWFKEMLRAVLEIARPNTHVDGEARLFLKDMQDGINLALERG